MGPHDAPLLKAFVHSRIAYHISGVPQEQQLQRVLGAIRLARRPAPLRLAERRRNSAEMVAIAPWARAWQARNLWRARARRCLGSPALSFFAVRRKVHNRDQSQQLHHCFGLEGARSGITQPRRQTAVTRRTPPSPRTRHPPNLLTVPFGWLGYGHAF